MVLPVILASLLVGPVGDRVTSLEAWGRRARHDFTVASVEQVRHAGFTGVFLNGGSGFGPDMIPLELAAESPVLPRLAPYTVKANAKELDDRAKLLKDAGMDAWWCLWGVIGPDESDQTTRSGPSNRLFDRRGKLEMKAEFLRAPELFGCRDPRSLSWRGSRPLCLSNPKVREFYRDVFGRIVKRYDLKGMYFFPGDNGAECCDDFCPRCKASGTNGFGRMIGFANELLAAARAVKPDFRLYVGVWNAGHRQVDRFLKELDPAVGLAMSFTDGCGENRAGGRMYYNQPWANFGETGPAFRALFAKTKGTEHPLMAIGEIAESEVWDPLHHMPNPRATIHLLRNVYALSENVAVMDFWGERRPHSPHANFAAMRVFLSDPAADDGTLLARAAREHYGLAAEDRALLADAVSAWDAFEKADRGSSLVSWPQRFSYAIGREGARGHFFRALVPSNLKAFDGTWAFRASFGNHRDFPAFMKLALGDRERFGRAADAFAALSGKLAARGNAVGAETARVEGLQIRLAGEFYASEARWVAAVRAYREKDAAALRRLVEEEVDARVRELEISARLPSGLGASPLLVDEDLNNMRLYLSLDTFPEAPPGVFHFTETPYSE